MAPGNLAISKRKRPVVVKEDYYVSLQVSIKYAQGIDKDTTNPKGDKRIYTLIGWVRPHQFFQTPMAQGLPDPEWKVDYHFPLGWYSDQVNLNLNLEIYRIGSWSDPGTSTGNILVGRTSIPLPTYVNPSKCGRFGLVVPNGAKNKAEGYVILMMEIKRMVARNDYY